ncbi:Ictacalcin [Collichthys lucidus]|uniref:Protein S100 n=1 Tax=Collichthys lucidus TaxID=240159 RepID=A0A4U5VML1_COLLU|nr:Ictacalcin [Collichthys lucidus]
MSDIVTAISLLIKSFNKYACKEGNPCTLNKGELKLLLQNELGELLQKANNKDELDTIFQDLDTNKDNSVDFTEFGRLVLCLTVMCHEYFINKK